MNNKNKKIIQADIWRALKPLTFTALALKPSTSIKSVETTKTADGRETEEGKRGLKNDKKEYIECKEDHKSERWEFNASHRLNLTFDRQF